MAGVHFPFDMAGDVTDAIEIGNRAGGDRGYPGLVGPQMPPAASRPNRLYVMQGDGWDVLDDASKTAFRDGWYYPGDLGWRDVAGYLFLAGRAKDLIIRGGVNVYPAEIEHVLNQHAMVLDAAVVAWPSREFGEEIAAFVVARNGNIDTEEILSWCRKNLARYKLPREVFVIDDLPKSGVGKVLKHELTDRLTPLD